MNHIAYQKLSLEDQQVTKLIAEIKSIKANNKLISDADLMQILSTRADIDQINLALALSQHHLS
ncbi:MAG TPA: hypothetical protein PLZ62_03635 [bacterium]|nr:hypothetical protein [bacterium]